MSSKLQLLIKWVWISATVICFVLYLSKPELFSKEQIATFLGAYKNYAWLIYFLIHIFRGFVLLPSTPLIFAGVIFFPEHLIWVLIISLLGIITCSLLIYFFSQQLGLVSVFEKQKSKLSFIESKIKGPYSFLYIFLWAFIPIVPTDLICYVSGALKVKIPIFIVSLFLGELVLCSIYIFGSALIIH